MGLRDDYAVFNKALSSLYEDETMVVAADEPPFKFNRELFDAAAEGVYENNGFDSRLMEGPRTKALMQETFRVLDTAVSSALPHEVPTTIRYALENNAFVFSGFKTYHMLREVGLSMLTEKGDIKPFGEFLMDVKRINTLYNQNYLYAEYNHAVGAAQMAAKWHDFEQDGDRYNLQYRTAGDDKVREEHAALNGITLPPSAPFWEQFLPPNGWNCRCTTVQVRKNKYPTSDPEEAMKRGLHCTEGVKNAIFRHNVGKSLELFPPKHPYLKAPTKDKQVIERVTQEAIKEKRIQDMIDELPNSLTTDEKKAIAEHNLKLEEALKITKGFRMSVEQADQQHANPHYGESREYGINCQTCAPAYALRLMGFDVTAKGNTKDSLSDYLSRQRSFEAWTNTDGTPAVPTLTHDWMVAKGYKQMSKERYAEYFNKCTQETGVYILTIGWKCGGGHATVLQRFDDGTLSYIEPQVYNEKIGTKRSIGELCESGAIKPSSKRGILRVDNKLFNTKFASIFDK